jgi:hypothetical protein
MKSKLSGLFVSALIFMSVSNKAFAASSEVCADISGPGVNGLCTEADKGQKWVDEEWCKTIYDQVTGRNSEDKCASDQFAELSGKIKNTFGSGSYAGNNFKGLFDYCPTIYNIMKTVPDQDAFIAGLLQQIIASLVIAESGWKQDAVGCEVVESSGKRAQGILQLEAGSVGAEKYNCGCKDVTSDEQLKADPKLSLKCGTHIALYWMNQDSEIGSGSGNDGSRGAARYFQPFRDIDIEKRHKLERKVAEYCKTFETNTPAGAEEGPGTTGNSFGPPSNGTAYPERF